MPLFLSTCTGTPASSRFVEFCKLRSAFSATERTRAEIAEKAQQDAIPRLLELGLTIEQIASALSLPQEEVMHYKL